MAAIFPTAVPSVVATFPLRALPSPYVVPHHHTPFGRAGGRFGGGRSSWWWILDTAWRARQRVGVTAHAFWWRCPLPVVRHSPPFVPIDCPLAILRAIAVLLRCLVALTRRRFTAPRMIHRAVDLSLRMFYV